MFTKKDLTNLIIRTPRDNSWKISFDYSDPIPDREWGKQSGHIKKWKHEGKLIENWIEASKLSDKPRKKMEKEVKKKEKEEYKKEKLKVLKGVFGNTQQQNQLTEGLINAQLATNLPLYNDSEVIEPTQESTASSSSDPWTNELNSALRSSSKRQSRQNRDKLEDLFHAEQRTGKDYKKPNGRLDIEKVKKLIKKNKDDFE